MNGTGSFRRSTCRLSATPRPGFFATANEMNLPADWPHAQWPVGFEWTEASRATRIHEVLGAGGTFGVAESMALQTDPFSVPARRLCALLAAMPHAPTTLSPALALLAGWDHRLTADSPAAALFETWFTRHLRHAVFCPAGAGSGAQVNAAGRCGRPLPGS